MPAALHSRLTRLACAVLALSASLPATALIIRTGAVDPIPPDGVVPAGLAVGSFAMGSIEVNGGSILSSGALWMAGGATSGDGSVLVTGTGSSVGVSALAGGNLDVGGRGAGHLNVTNGANMSYGLASAECQLSCRVFVSNAAGSSGRFSVAGAGSVFSTPGQVIVGNASVFAVAAGDAFDYGVRGASSLATAQLTAGAVSLSSGLTVANPGGGMGRSGTELSVGNVLVDGPGSTWNLVRNAAQTGPQALLALAAGNNTQGSLSVRNGGLLRLDGSASGDQFSGANIGSGGAGAQATLRVEGAGSRLEVAGPMGYINVGSFAGSVGELRVSGGGVVSGLHDNELAFATIGRNGGTGTLTVSDPGSIFRLSGKNAVTGAGAFLNIGRTTSSGAGSVGTLNIGAGGRVEVDSRGLVLSNANSLSGFYVGGDSGNTGTLVVGGLGSVFAVTGGTGYAPYGAVGRDGGTGTALISGGAQLTIDSAHASDPALAVNTSGNSVVFDIGRNATLAPLASTGTVTVSGLGSLLALSGVADNYLVVGRGAGATGTLNITAGGRVQALDLQIGRDGGATGALNMSGGILALSGSFTSGVAKGRGALFNIGHNGATGTANIGAGSVVTVTSTTGLIPALTVGGSLNNPGGTGTLNLSGGATLSVAGNAAAIRVGQSGVDAANPGVGTVNLGGAGTSLSATAGASGVAGSIVIGGGSFTSGTLNVGAGASVSSDGFVGVAYNNGSLAGSGRLVVNGTVVAPNVIVGSSGSLSGSGLIIGKLTNYGVINPGNSPGTLRVDGDFDNAAGQLMLEVQRQGDGSYRSDQLLFMAGATLRWGSGQIAFRFLGDTDPTAFQQAGLFTLASFFKEMDATGQTFDLSAAELDAFSNASFVAQAEAYAISNFSFNAAGGATFTAAAVPEAPPLAMLAAGLLMLGLRGRWRGGWQGRC